MAMKTVLAWIGALTLAFAVWIIVESEIEAYRERKYQRRMRN